MKRLVVLLLLSDIFIYLNAQSVTIGYSYYSVKGATCEVCGVGNGHNSYHVKIQPKVNIDGKEYVVNKIGDNAYKNWFDLYSVEIPEGIIEIGSDAFSGCHNLSEVEIPEGVKEIGKNAFWYSGLYSLKIPSSVVKIGYNAFSYTKISYPILSEGLTEIGIGAFSDTPLMRITIPSTVTKIGRFAFENCKDLYTVNGLHSNMGIDSTTFQGSSFNYAYNKLIKTYKYFAEGKIQKDILLWQQKKKYETTEQWMQRVTPVAQNKKIKQSIKEAENEYINQNKPSSLKWKICSYDADYNIYSIYFDKLDTLFIKVPQQDASIFKLQHDKIKLIPSYGIINDHIALLSCVFQYGNKKFLPAKTYTSDNTDYLASNLPPINFNIKNTNTNSISKDHPLTAQDVKPKYIIDKSIDKNIPISSYKNNKTFALIIGNEDYNKVIKVDYALNDANIFSEYCQKTLGIPQNNIRKYNNATYGVMLSALQDIRKISEAYQGDINLIFYYAGHGIPNEKNNSSYLLPVDADGSQPEVCLATNHLYKELESMNIKSVLVLMDACFSGSQRGNGMLSSARGVALKVKEYIPTGQMIIVSAASGDETAYPFKEKEHGMFTYFLLKKIRETKGDVTLGELSNYIKTNVSQQSIVINRKSQTPNVTSSVSMGDNWKNVKLK